ncbi:hypothetical protein ACGF8D_10450 [Streptomyces massasporeus]|uniref:hypothetical protein n=1 Tax=Streptomyces massasporeus TaxID=67324 RepID=UPI00371BC38A
MPEPDWEGALRATVSDWIPGDIVKEGAYQALLPHIEAAYQRGLMAGRSQAGYATRRKKTKEGPWSARSASDTDASAGET